MHEEDRELAGRMAAGRDEAFRQFFDDYFPRVYRFCTRRLPEEAAEEVTQAVMINGVRKISRYRGEASLFTWLCQIARHEIGAHYRRQQRHRDVLLAEDHDAVRAELESLAADPAFAPEHLADHREGQAIVQLILDHLPGDYGRVLEWKYMEGCTVDEIAGRLVTTPIAVQSMLARARHAFRQQYRCFTEDAAGYAAPGKGTR